MMDTIKLPVQGFEPLMSEAEAIEFLGLQSRKNPSGSLRWMMKAGKLAYIRLGRGVISFRRSELERYIQSCEVGHG